MKKNVENVVYVEAPVNYEISHKENTVFFGGTITGAKDWQKNLLDCVVNKVKRPVTIFNPRRNSFDINNTADSEIQISWEYKYLNLCDILVFYFAEETLGPITLFELGGALERNLCSYYQNILVYCEPEYKRKFDVNYQIKLVTESFFDMQKTVCYPPFVNVYDDYDKFVDDLINLIDNH